MSTPRKNRDGPITVTLVIFCQSFQGLSFGALALFMPLIREDMSITFAQGGMLSAAATLTYALGQIPAGYLSDRFGPKRLFFFGMLGSTLLAINLGMTQTFEWALVNQFFSGIFRTLLFAPGLTLVASWFPPDRKATAMGLYVIGGFSGNLLLSLIGPLLVADHGWRWPFIGFAMLGVCASFLYLFLGKEKPSTGKKQPVGLLDAFQLAKFPIMWVCSAIQFIRFGVVTSFNFWLPSYLVADRGMSLQTAGLITALGAACTAFANAFGGYVSDRLKNPPLVIGGSLAILTCTSALLVNVHSVPAIIAVVALNSMFMQFYFGPLFYVPVEVLGQRVAGMSTGFSNMFANFGALLAAYSLGAVKDYSGAFTWGFFGTSAACAVGVVLSVVLARMRTKSLAGRGSAPA